MNVLLDDLKLSAGHVITHVLNALPEGARSAVAVAYQKGGTLEIRTRPAPPEHMSVWIVGVPGEADLILASLDQPLQPFDS